MTWIEPTERALWLVAATAAVGLLGAVMPTVGAAAPIALIMLVVAAIIDGALAGSPRAPRVARAIASVVVQGKPAAVATTIECTRALDVLVTGTLPHGAQTAGSLRDVARRVQLQAGATTITDDVVFAARGRHTFGRVTLRSIGPLGLVRLRARRDVVTDVVVVPDVARIGAVAERLLRGRDEGRRTKRRAAEGREFESLREYRRGDDVRLVEWKASARKGDLVVKRLQPETRQDVVVLLDTGRHLAGRHEPEDGGAPRLDTALEAALTLAAAALAKGDRVSLVAFAGDVRGYAPPDDGKGHLRRVAGAANDLTALAEEADYGVAVQFVLARQKRRAMVVVVTDVLDEPSARALAAAVVRLRGRHLPVVVALADPSLARLAKAKVTSNDDTERAVPVAAAHLLAHRRRALAALESVGAVVVDAPSSRAAAMAVEAYVAVKATGRL